MFIRLPFIILLVCFMLSAGSLFAETSQESKPVTQVCEVRGEAFVKSCADCKGIEVKEGLLLSGEDIVVLEKGASVGLYFKDGGKAKVEAEKSPLTYKINDLLPKKEVYKKAAPAFGATRGVYKPEPVMDNEAQEFFYPQKTIILSSAPLIELTIFDGSGAGLRISRANIKILENGVALNSKELAGVEPAVTCSYSCTDLECGKEYTAEIQLEIAEITDRTIFFTFDFYVAGSPSKGLASSYEPFCDSIYKSLEYVSVGYGMQKHEFWFLKNLKFKKDKTQPIVSIETFVK